MRGAPASPTVYPPGILALDAAAGDTTMRTVWNLRDTAGRTEPTTNTYVRDTNVPAGFTDSGGGLLYSPNTATWGFSHWDMRNGVGGGAQILGRGGSTLISVSQCELGNPPASSQCFAMGELGIATGPTNYEFDRITVNGEGMKFATAGSGERAAFFQAYADAADVTITNARFDSAPLMLFKMTATGILTVSDTFYGRFAYDPKIDSHYEQWFIDRAATGSKVSRTLFDSSGYVSPISGLTAPTVYFEAYLIGDIDIEFEQCALTIGDWDALYCMQAAVRQAGRVLNLLFDRCAIEAGSGGTGYIGVTREAGTCTITSTGSVDLRTGANIDAILNAL